MRKGTPKKSPAKGGGFRSSRTTIRCTPEFKTVLALLAEGGECSDADVLHNLVRIAGRKAGISRDLLQKI